MKILLVQTSFLGDTVLSTPLIAGIRALYPGAELWMMVTPLSRGVVERDPLLAGVLVFDKRGSNSGLSGILRMARRLRAMGFDKAYALHRSYRTSLLLWLSGIPARTGFYEARLSFLYNTRRSRRVEGHDVQRNMALLGAEDGFEKLPNELRLFPPADGELGNDCRSALDATPFAVLAPGSSWPTKMWDWKHYRSTAGYLLGRGLRVIILGAPEECAVAEKVSAGLDVINLAGRTSVAESLAVIKRAALVICNDSAALHIASAFKVPTVAVFCSTVPEFGFGPWRNERSVIVEKNGLACRPCGRHGRMSCPPGHQRCMRDLESQSVIAAVETLLDGGGMESGRTTN